MKRTVIGNLFGTPGMYVSQPGDDLDNPTKNLLLDSRFSALDIYYTGVQPLDRSGPVNGTYTYLGIANFPPLGYVPIAYVGLIDNGSDVISYPPNVLDINGRIATDPQIRISDGQIYVRYFIGGGQGTFPASFSYVIFRNPA